MAKQQGNNTFMLILGIIVVLAIAGIYFYLGITGWGKNVRYNPNDYVTPTSAPLQPNQPHVDY